MTLASETDIERFADDVREIFGDNLEEIKLFGSYARDEHVPGSDIDILVVVEERRDDEVERLEKVSGDYLLDEDLRFDAKVIEKQEYDQKLEEGFSFFREVEEHGVEV